MARLKKGAVCLLIAWCVLFMFFSEANTQTKEPAKFDSKKFLAEARKWEKDHYRFHLFNACNPFGVKFYIHTEKEADEKKLEAMARRAIKRRFEGTYLESKFIFPSPSVKKYVYLHDEFLFVHIQKWNDDPYTIVEVGFQRRLKNIGPPHREDIVTTWETERHPPSKFSLISEGVEAGLEDFFRIYMRINGDECRKKNKS